MAGNGLSNDLFQFIKLFISCRPEKNTLKGVDFIEKFKVMLIGGVTFSYICDVCGLSTHGLPKGVSLFLFCKSVMAVAIVIMLKIYFRISLFYNLLAVTKKYINNITCNFSFGVFTTSANSKFCRLYLRITSLC